MCFALATLQEKEFTIAIQVEYAFGTLMFNSDLAEVGSVDADSYKYYELIIEDYEKLNGFDVFLETCAGNADLYMSDVRCVVLRCADGCVAHVGICPDWYFKH